MQTSLVKLKIQYSKLNLEEIIVTAIGILLFSASFYLELNKYIWLDEFDTILQIKVNSLRELISSYYNGEDTHPPLYFILAYYIQKIFGQSVYALRLLSAITTALGIYVVIKLLKKLIKDIPLHILFLCIVIIPYISSYLISEMRPYPLFFLLTLLVLHYRLKILQQSSLQNLIIYFVVLSSFLYTHYYSALYLTIILITEIIISKRFNSGYKLLLVYSTAIIIFLIWIPAIINQRSAFGNVIHHPLPNWQHYLNIPFTYFRYISPIIVIMACYGIYFLWKNIIDIKINLFMIFNMAFIITPFLLIPISCFINPVFAPRYFIPTFTGYLMFSIIGLITLSKKISYSYLLILLIVMISYGFIRIIRVHNSILKEKSRVNQFCSLSDKSVFVCESPHLFSQVYFYSNQVGKKQTLLVHDIDLALKSKNKNQCVFDYFWLEKRKREKNIQNILDWKLFRELNINKFYLVDEKNRPLFENVIKNDPKYNWKFDKDSLIYVQTIE